MIAIIVPVYNEASSIAPFVDAICSALRDTDESCEIFFINDGSDDLTSESVKGLKNSSLPVRQFDLCRNFGKQRAIFFGLKRIVADGYLIIDVDLQDPVHVVPILINKLSEGYDSVFTQRINYNDSSRIYSFFARMYYYLIALVSGYHVNLHSNDYSIISSSVRNRMIEECKEKTFVFRCARDYFASNQYGIKIERGRRHIGKSNYNFYKRAHLFLLSLRFKPNFKILFLFSVLATAIVAVLLKKTVIL